MMTVIGCITNSHNVWLVLVAALVCVAGSIVTMRLYLRSAATKGLQSAGWHMLTAVAAGATIWCTHFIAMLGYQPGVPVDLDPVLTIVSLLLAVVGVAIGTVMSAGKAVPQAAPMGGAVVGLTIAAMHYVGMMGYRVQGIVSWDMPYLVASVLLSIGLSALAFHLATRRGKIISLYGAAATLTLAIVSLHFTGMAAFRIEWLAVDGSFSNPAALQALALAIAGVAFVILGAGIASYLIDDSVRSESYERLRQMAMVDHLTGLPNRASLSEWLDHELDHCTQDGGKLAVICIDLDRFKEINDLRGHAAGDEVLRVLAQRMTALRREGEYIARLGGDEFAAIKSGGDAIALKDFLGRLEAALLEPIRVGEHDVSPGASIGVTLYPDDAVGKQELLSNADLAMYRAKATINESICFYDLSMDAQVRERKALAGELREAVTTGQLEVHYQVQRTVSTGETHGYEALLRWRHPQRGFVQPSEFIPLAEETGLILQIGEWVLREACSKAACWKPGYKVAVNVSPVQFVQADLPQLVLRILVDTGLPPERLELELTESTIFADKARSLHIVRQIKALGVSIALDDFGTGYSSLDTLRTFPFDKIKLDRSFMGEVETDVQAQAMVRAVLALGRSLSIPVLAEGIETAGQLSLLTNEGCDEVQGYFLGRPMPLEAIIESGQLSITNWRENKSRIAPETLNPVLNMSVANILIGTNK